MDARIDLSASTVKISRLFCFEISGHGIGKCISCVAAPDEESARARTTALFRDCDLTPVHRESMLQA